MNRTCHSIIGESFEITSTVSLKLEYVCIAEYTVHPIFSYYYFENSVSVKLNMRLYR